MRYITLTSLLITFLSVAPVYAESSSDVAFDKATRDLIKSGDPAKGKTLIKKCTKCHSENGIAEDPEDPNIAGQSANYMFKQMMDYKNNKRDNKAMRKRVRKLDAQTMAHISAWYASLPAPPAMGKTSAAMEKLVFKGDPTRMLKPCATCHGRKGEGGKYDSARLTGMSRDYFVTTMTEFKEGDRENDIYSRMRTVAEVLTEEEIEALADYYSAEPPPEEE
ncbi:MAG: cytochrome c4 [Gammaproteobacteria bacterium]|nr:MAG: cytochrome c4 [Gammaproteobacteria bacterium]